MRKLTRERVESIRREKGKILNEEGKLVFPYLKKDPVEPQASRNPGAPKPPNLAPSDPAMPAPTDTVKQPAGKQTVQKQDQPAQEVAMSILSGLSKVVDAQAQNTAAILQIQNELLQPKPKRQWKCTIGRNNRGEMSTVDINEV
jgi:hypothetical protein